MSQRTSGRMRPVEDATVQGTSWGRLGSGAWLVMFALLVVWVVFRLDLFDVWTWVTTVDGVRVRLPDTYATVDHPFHAARAESLRLALADGHWLRWIGHHQGGYPVEFYPLGVASLDVALWGLFLGLLPMAFIHKLAVGVIFLLPAAGFVLLARRDQLSLGVALLATAAHVAINGWWWSGGYMELVAWGLITNVAAHVVQLFVLVGLVSYARTGSRAYAALAAGAAAFAIYSNPRSLLPLAVIGIATLIAVAIDHAGDGRERRSILPRIALVGVLAALLAAPELIALMRFTDLYYFVHFSGYDDLAVFLDSSIQAVSGPVFVAGIAGLGLGLFVSGRIHARAAAIALVIYASLTGILSTGAWFEDTIEQLELTRLMPFQRLLTIYVAAIAVHDLLGFIVTRIARLRRIVIDLGLATAAILVLVLYVLSPPSFIPVGDRSLYEIQSAADPAIADLEASVRAADEQAPPGTAVLILGTTVSWHDQLWAPFWSDRLFFYDDWLWYWQTDHYGPYDPTIEHAYPVDGSTLDAEYLRRHGIGAVVVTGEAKADAAMSPMLRQIRASLYDVYLVREPTTIVTFGDANATAVMLSDHEITATGASDGGAARIRRNWFPRWSATVNGDSAPITETDDGYMTVPVPRGEHRIELTYATDGWDWIGRASAALGIAAMVALLLPLANVTSRRYLIPRPAHPRRARSGHVV